MKSIDKYSGIRRYLGVLALASAGILAATAQSSAPAPGSGGSFTPNPSNGIGWNPGPGGPGGPATLPPAGPAWGGPWGGGWNSSPSVIVNIPFNTPNWQNSGVTNVVGVGYDAQGIYRTIPMTVSYNYDGSFYNVTILNAWNPWTDTWNRGIDQQAFSTTYFLKGTYYDFYTVLSTGTYYFNL